MAVVDTTAGFKFQYRMCGEPPTLQHFLLKDTETISKGDLINAESGYADLAATNDVAFLGASVSPTVAGITHVTQIEVIVDDDAVYSVYDANARSIGDTLDIAGATGAQTVAATSNADVVVVANSTADQLTLVRIIPANHATHL